jgi:hypothetical protein
MCADSRVSPALRLRFAKTKLPTPSHTRGILWCILFLCSWDSNLKCGFELDIRSGLRLESCSMVYVYLARSS